MKLGKKRLLIAASGVTAIGAAATLVAGVTFGLFSSSVSPSDGPNSFTAGTVTLAQTATASCTIGPMNPGDSSTGWAGNPVAKQTDSPTAPCTFSVNYVGTVGAYIGLGLVTAGTGLYDGTGSGLQFQVTDVPAAAYSPGGVINTNSAASPLYVSNDPSGTTGHTFTVNYALPRSSPNSYQGKSTTLTMTVYAVQDSNNGTAATCVAGSQCASAANGIWNWS